MVAPAVPAAARAAVAPAVAPVVVPAVPAAPPVASGVVATATSCSRCRLPTYTPLNAPVPTGEVVVERASTAQELGPKFNRTAADVVRFLMEQGEMVTATQSLSDDMIELFAAEIGAEMRLVDPGEEQEVELQKLARPRLPRRRRGRAVARCR